MALRNIFYGVLLVMLLERVIELYIARKNTERLLSRGAVEWGREHYRAIVNMHVAFFISMLTEAWVGYPTWGGPSYFFLGLFLMAQAGRAWVLRTLRGRWTTRVLVLPGEHLIHHGPYRWLKHPNYMVVALEILALPAMFGLYWTAFVFSILNAYLLLRRRLPVERRALDWATQRSSMPKQAA